jgi:AsmA protein
VRLDNTQLAGFDLASKMGPAAALVGAKPGSNTTVQILSLNLREAGGALDAQNIILTVAGLGTATGNGTVSAAKALNFHVIAKLQGSVANAATTAVSMIGGTAGGLMGGALKNGIPVTITGTASSPIITPDMRGLTSGVGRNPASLLGQNGPQLPNKNLGKALGGLLGRH